MNDKKKDLERGDEERLFDPGDELLIGVDHTAEQELEKWFEQNTKEMKEFLKDNPQWSTNGVTRANIGSEEVREPDAGDVFYLPQYGLTLDEQFLLEDICDRFVCHDDDQLPLNFAARNNSFMDWDEYFCALRGLQSKGLVRMETETLGTVSEAEEFIVGVHADAVAAFKFYLTDQ